MIPAAAIWPVTRDAPADLEEVEEVEVAVELAPVFAEPESLNNNHVRFENEKGEEPTRSLKNW